MCTVYTFLYMCVRYIPVDMCVYVCNCNELFMCKILQKVAFYAPPLGTLVFSQESQQSS